MSLCRKALKQTKLEILMETIQSVTHCLEENGLTHDDLGADSETTTTHLMLHGLQLRCPGRVVMKLKMLEFRKKLI